MATTTKTETNSSDSPDPPAYSSGFSDGMLIGITGMAAAGFWILTALLYGAHPYVTVDVAYSWGIVSPTGDSVGGSLIVTALFVYSLVGVSHAEST